MALLGVDDGGELAFVERVSHDPDNKQAINSLVDQKLAEIHKKWQFHEDQVRRLTPSQFVIPGFIDTHIHAPQFVFTGTGYDLTLLQWLEKYTFPREAAFKSSDYAKECFHKVVRRTAMCGTTTACYFATTHLEASKTLADVVDRVGQRAFIGKVNMDRNSPDYYTETTEESIESTLKIIEYIQGHLKSPLITPVLTPRFVPSCTPELMKALGDIAAKHNLPIQSHLSETPSELEWVASLHPEAHSYTDVYDRFGLLTSRTLMAHCVHLSRQERDLLRDRQVGISHCPSSNFCLHSGVMNLRRLLQEGHHKIGLGTDVAGGYSPSIMDAMRQAIIASKVIHVDSRERLSEAKKSGKLNQEVEGEFQMFEPLSFSEAFYLGTLGGAKVLGIEKIVGNFEPGKSFDALIIDIAGDGRKTTVETFSHDDPISIFEKFIYLGDDRNIADVYVGSKGCISR